MTENANQKTVVVGMSGGVDSSVVACLLRKQGYNVVGLHMKSSCEDEKLVLDISKKIGIDCHIVEYENQMQKVKDYFIEEYKNGKTPNPCVLCNKIVKFSPFIEFAEKINADYFATGHYAKIEHGENGHVLLTAKDESKDQTYFLNQLSQQQLKNALFPLGDFTKDEVRKLAKEFGLPNSDKKDSYDVCFLGDEKFKEYMSKNYPEKSGNIVDKNTGNIIGKHKGLNQYTIGQRKGLGIGGGVGKTLDPWFVAEKDLKTNTLFVAQGADDLLYSNELVADEFNWIPEKPVQNNFDCLAKIRYRQSYQKVNVQVIDEQNVKINFYEKQKAITPGQYVVLYLDDASETKCLGGGKIK